VTNLSIKLYGFITGLLQREGGQDLVEYAVLVGFIGIAAAVALFLLMPSAMNTMRDTIAACLTFDTTKCTL
jgi:hypothetical protein